MLTELYDLGLRLREKGELPPPGFADYAAPIWWTISLRPPKHPGYPPQAELSERGGARPRPDSGRTSGVLAYPLVDTAAYVLGRDEKDDGKQDRQAAKKHEAFRHRLDEVAEAIEDSDLVAAIHLLGDALDQGVLTEDPQLEQVAADHWVSVQMMDGPLKGEHLFEHEAVRRWWAGWLDAEVKKKGFEGTCSITGEHRPLVDRIPGKGYFRGKASLLGLNEDAYVSYVGGGGAAKKASIGVSYDAADVANRALGYLARSERHKRTLVYDKESDLRTLTAVFWLGEDDPVEVSGKGVFESDDFLSSLGDVVGRGFEDEAPERDLKQIHNLLKLPWAPKRESLRLDEVGFYLAILSKNAYRVVVREWLALDLADVKKRLDAFLEATSIVRPGGGEPHPVSIQQTLKALDGGSPNLGRDLLRTAFADAPLPQTILQPCLARLRVLFVKGDAPWWQEHALAALLKLTLSHQPGTAMTDSAEREKAYLCGKLLAVLGRIQQDALTTDNVVKTKEGEEGTPSASLNRTVTQRVFAAASTAPEPYLTPLVQRATVAHLPKLPEGPQRSSKPNEKDYRWTPDRGERELRGLMAEIDKSGGFPHILDLHGQAQFALGFYRQRADFFSSSTPETPSDHD
ncbi:MAG: type I-C CRISPR-associated protein Cas8c/Csd1 [Bacteroidota bacterium]